MGEALRARMERWGVQDLLSKYPDLRLTPRAGDYVTIDGRLSFAMEAPGKGHISDEYSVELAIPDTFPTTPPVVRETGGRIPGTFHQFTNGGLCLGSPTRLRLMLMQSPSLLRYVERCVIPYLYGYSYYQQHSTMPFGELEHGTPGLRQDLMPLFRTTDEYAVPAFVRLTTMKRRDANKQPCPCGSRRRLGRCHHMPVNALRKRLGRQWFRIVYATLQNPASGGQADTSIVADASGPYRQPDIPHRDAHVAIVGGRAVHCSEARHTSMVPHLACP